MNPQIIGSDLRTSGIESNDALFGIHFAEHSQHAFQIIVIEIKDSLKEEKHPDKNGVRLVTKGAFLEKTDS